MKRSIGEEIIDGLEDFAKALETNASIPAKYTCRRIALDLHPQTYGPTLVRKTRTLLGVSQAVFAQFLGVSVKTVSAWEQGRNVPQDVACRLMDEIRHDPPYWQRLEGNGRVEKRRVETKRQEEARPCLIGLAPDSAWELMMPPAVYVTLAIVVMGPIAWFVSEFQERRWLAFARGSISISLCFAVAVLVGKLERWNDNAWYGFASKSLIEATIAGLESGKADQVLVTYKRLQSEFSPTYENRARYDVLVEKAVSEMRSEEQSSKTAE